MQQKGTRFFIQDWLPRLVSLSGIFRVDSSAGSARRCTGRGWSGWSCCLLDQWKKLQILRKAPNDRNIRRKVPVFSSWIDSQCWTACQVCSGWTPRPDPLGVVQGEAGVTDPEVMHFHKEKSCLLHSLQIFLNCDCLCFCWLLGATLGHRVTQPFGANTKCLNYKIWYLPDFSSRIDSQSWTACQA